ncbi:MAG: hypothetical protein AB1728_08425 [Bacteroidota bacterium]
MDTSEFDIEFLTQKLSENPQSPLFARLADLYIAKEQTVEALQLCEEGIKTYPQYYAGYVVLGKTHLALKEYSKARSAFERAHDLSPFNHAITQLIASIPDKPDESTRTTDENYFTPSTEQQQQVEESLPVTQVQEQVETVQPAPELQFESPTAEEMGFTQSAEEIDTAALAEQQIPAPQTGNKFPPFDEYFAQNQSQVTAGPVSTLDEYLGGSTSPSVQQTEFVSESSATIEPVSLPDENITPQTHEEPEAVFSSPEQAQLFAEMMGEQTAGETSPESSPDIGDLAEKLQNVERIVPEENYQSQLPQNEETQSYESEMVTPTLAEIYASQGEYNAAIQAYEILMFSQPAKAPEFQRRIQELQRKQMEKEGLI